MQSLMQGDIAAAPEAAECIEVDSGGATESDAIAQGRRAQGELRTSDGRIRIKWLPHLRTHSVNKQDLVRHS